MKARIVRDICGFRVRSLEGMNIPPRPFFAFKHRVQALLWCKNNGVEVIY